MEDMIWKVHGDAWQCSNCSTIVMCSKLITDLKYCPNCGYRATAYETEMHEPGKPNAIVMHPMEEHEEFSLIRWEVDDDSLSDDFEERVKEVNEMIERGDFDDI